MTDPDLERLPFVSLVIPAHNSSRTLEGTIKACLEQSYPRDKRELIVVDDGSGDNSREIAARYPLQYIYQEKGGASKARNTGWKRAKGDIVCFVDSDCRPERQWVEKMLAHYQSPGVVCVGGRYGLANPESRLATCIYHEFLARYRRMPDRPKFIGSYGYSFRRSFLAQLGGYDEGFLTASAEDNDLAYRIMASGHEAVFDQNIVIYHHFPTRLLPYLRTQYRHGYWRMRLYRKHANMIRGDDYSTPFDFLQPPLAMAFIVLVPFLGKRVILWAEVALLGLLFLCQIVMTTRMLRVGGSSRDLLHVPLGAVRAVARGMGMIVGIARFWLGRRP